MDIDTEALEMKRVLNQFKKHIISLTELENTLKQCPHILHLSTHGTHNYKSKLEDKFSISFQERQVIYSLIDDHPKYSAYYAAIAIFIECEISHFILNASSQYTFIPIGDFFTNKKLFIMLTTIIGRYGCMYKEIMFENEPFIQIWFGMYSISTHTPDIKLYPDVSWVNNNNQMIDDLPSPVIQQDTCPNLIPYQFTFEMIFAHDSQVQYIKKYIIGEYKSSLIRYPSPQCQHMKYAWTTLIRILHRMFSMYDIYPINDDDDDDDEPEDEFSDFSSDDEFTDDDSSDMEYKECKNGFVPGTVSLTCVKFDHNQELIRELKIIPKVRTENQSAEYLSLIRNFLKKLISTMKKVNEIGIDFDMHSKTHANVHIIKFLNMAAIGAALPILRKCFRNYKQHYWYTFRPLSKADKDTRKQCGYIDTSQEKRITIDLKHKSDPISKLVAKYLISRTQCKLKLLILVACHSYVLAKVFAPYVANIICVHPYVMIADTTATTFTKHFYPTLRNYLKRHRNTTLLGGAVILAFNKAILAVSKACSNDNACESHSHIFKCEEEYNQIHPVIGGVEDWQRLQKTMQDPEEFALYFKSYREEYGHMHPKENLYHQSKLVISNVSLTNAMRILGRLAKDHPQDVWVEEVEEMKVDFCIKMGSSTPSTIAEEDDYHFDTKGMYVCIHVVVCIVTCTVCARKYVNSSIVTEENIKVGEEYQT